MKSWGKLWIVRIVTLSLSVGLLGCGDDEKPDPIVTGNNSINNSNNSGSNNSNNATNNSTNGSNNSNNATNNVTNGTNGSNNVNNDNNANNKVDCTLIDPAIGACDPLCQEGCDDGQTCVARQASTSDPVAATCETAGAGVQGDTCNADSDCAVGTMCIALDGAEKQCRAFCRPGADIYPQCEDGFICRSFQLELRVGVCDQVVDACTIFPDSCGATQNCYPTKLGMRCADFDAESMPGDACEDSSGCGGGYRCAAVADGEATCRPICDPNEANSCVEGTCHQMNDTNDLPLPWGGCL